MERKTLAKKTSVINLIARIIVTVMQFITRSMFLRYLGVEYLGLNSTLAQLIGTLNVSELGIQSVIIFKLYGPLANNDKEKINDIMSVYRLLYRGIFLFVIISGMALVPFLKYIVTNIEIGLKEITIAWIIMTITAALSYLLSYNYAIVTADQKLYLITCVESIIRVVLGLISILFLYLIPNYYLYLIINAFTSVMVNVSYLILRKKYYPWMRISKPTRETFSDILSFIKDGFAGKISSYIFNSTDNLLISAMISTALVGIYGNYYTIVSAITLVMSAIINPVQSIIGNYLVKANKNAISNFISNYTYTVYLICSILYMPTFLLMNDFVCLFYGSEYQIDKIIIILLYIDKYISFSSISVCSILDAAGKFNVQKKMYFVGAVINIMVSILGVVLFGLQGVLIGTIVGHLYYWIVGFKNCYSVVVESGKAEKKNYIVYNMKLLLLFSFISILLLLVFHLMNLNLSYFSFVIKGMITVLLTLIINLLLFRGSNELNYFLDILGIRRIIKNKS